MSRPSFQFYPDDWRNNSNLRRCSWAARGVWVEVICLMHDSDRYGTLGWTLKEVAQALGCPMALLKELAAKGVLKGCDAGECDPMVYTPRSGRKDGEPITLLATQPGPIWYSSRMLRDEYVRQNAGASSRFSGTKQDTSPPAGGAPNPSPSRRRGEDQSDGSTSSSPSPPSEVSSPSLRSVVPTQAANPRGCRLPDDWSPGPEERAFAQSLNLDAGRVSEGFRDYWRSKAGREAVKLDWPATWRGWCRREAERLPQARQAQRQPANTGLRAAALANFQTIRPTFDLDGTSEEIF